MRKLLLVLATAMAAALFALPAQAADWVTLVGVDAAWFAHNVLHDDPEVNGDGGSIEDVETPTDTNVGEVRIDLEGGGALICVPALPCLEGIVDGVWMPIILGWRTLQETQYTPPPQDDYDAAQLRAVECWYGIEESC